MADFDLALKLRLDQGNAQAGLRQFAGTAKGSFRDVDKSAKKAGKSLDDAFSTLGVRSTKQIQGDIKRVRQSLNRMGRDGRVSGQELARGQKAAREQISALKREAAGTGQAMSELRGRMFGTAAAATALAFGVSKAAGAYAEFNQGMAEVSTLLDDTGSIPQLTEQVRALTREYGGDVNKNSKALYDIISAGASGAAEAMGTLEVANRLALGGVTDVSTAADGLTSILNAYGYEGERAAEVSDALFTAVREGKTTVPELSRSIGQLAPLAATAGVGLEEMLSAVAALTAAGVKTPQAITGIRSAISNIIKPTTQAADLADKLGIEFNAAALESKGLAGFMDEVRRATGGSTEQMSLLFGDVEGLNAVLSLTGKGAQDFSDAIESMGDKAGATDKAVAKMMDTPAAKASQFKAAMKDVQLSLGQAATSLTPLLESLANLVNRFNELPEPVRNTTAMVALFAAALIPATLAIRSMSSVIKVITGMSIARSMAGAPAAIAATGNAAALATPKMRALAAVKFGVFAFTAVQLTRLAAAMYEAKKASDSLAESQQERMEGLYSEISETRGAQHVRVATEEEFDRMSDAAKAHYKRRLEESERFWVAQRDLISQQDVEENGFTGRVSSEALSAAKEARIRREALAEIEKHGEDRKKLESDLASDVADIKSDMRDEIQKELDAEIKAHEEANKKIDGLLKEREAIEGNFESTRQALNNYGVDPSEPEQKDLVKLDRNARTSLQEGDYKAAKQQAEQARRLIDELARSGEGDIRQLRTYLQSIEATALEAQAEQEKKAQADVEKIAETIKALKEDAELLKKIDIGFDQEAANQSADELRAQLQKRLDDKPLVIPVVTSDASGGGETPPGYATGGHISGPGTGTSDSMLARLSNGEYVIKAAAVRRFGKGFFDQLNNMRLPGFATGGAVENLSMPSLKMPGGGASAASGGDTIYLTLGGNQVGPVTADSSVTRQLKRAAAMYGGA